MPQPAEAGDQMEAPLACAAMVLLNRDTVLGWTETALALLGTSHQRMAAARAVDMLEPWPQSHDGHSSVTEWKAVVRRTGTTVRCCTTPVDGADPSLTLLQLLTESDAERIDQDATLLRALFSQARVGLAIHDRQLKVTRVSLTPEFQARQGSMLEPAGGHELSQTLLADDAAEINSRLRDVLDTGEALMDAPQRARPRDQPDMERFVSLSAIPLKDPKGYPSGVVATFTDITEEHRAREGRLLIGDAAQRIGSSLAPIACAQELVDVVVPAFADAAAVDLDGCVLSGEQPTSGLAERPIRRVANRGAADLLPQPLVPGETQGIALQPLGSEVPRRATIVIALRARGQTLGQVVMARLPKRPAFDSLDTEIAEEIISRTALIIDNARQYIRERRTVEMLQRSPLPPPPDEISAAQVALCNRPAADSGRDGSAWADVIPLSSARVAFVAGTTVGHGIEAAAAAGRLRTTVQTLSDLDLTPEELLTHVDELVRRLYPTSAHITGREVGATCLYAVYDPVTGCCTMASAGHPAPAILTSRGPTTVALTPGPALGIEGDPYELVEFARQRVSPARGSG